ncbi:cation:proton antiporter [Sphingobacterium shayense]|uniref:cation:proton antiporter n=1 Tax=Sphingobacterium shayense TaxID=626343 RepID=UPI0015577B8D|nr:cation:proton antiporter [Sphingobacterium shayense]NQD71692.1 cation:proton antiporter [Sphingobacterium shayense]
MDKFLEHASEAFTSPLTNPVLVFIVVLLIILISPVILRPIKIPGIIGFILFGVLIGPYGLNWLAKMDGHSGDMAGVDGIDLFSTIGLLYIMFIAGLELDMNEFQKTKNKSLLFGFLTFAFPICIGFPVSYFLLGYDLLPSVLIASMFATHTLVAYPIVTSYGISKNEVVAVTIGGTILTDTAVLVILAVIKGLSKGEIGFDFWLTLGISLTVFIAIMFGLIPRIAKWFFSKVEGEQTSHYIFVLAVIFIAAFLAELAGLEHIIGAFVAGLALNKLIPPSSALMNRIEFIGNALFIPFFLISVGMIVNLGVLFSGTWALVIVVALAAVSISGKFLASLVTQLVFKYTNSQRNLMHGLSNAHAAATLAVILVGYESGIIDEGMLNGTVALILISCLFASLLTEKASKRVVFEGHQDNTDAGHVQDHEEKILIPIANLNKMEPIIDFATFVKSKKSRYPLYILSVVESNQQAIRNLDLARKNLDKMAKYASGSETELDLITTIDYNIANGIGRTSRNIFADGIILGWPSATSFIEKIVGEKAESILNRTDTTLFMCKLDNPLMTHNAIIIFAPPLCESEVGFEFWMEKILKLAKELSLVVKYVCDKRTQDAIEEFLKNAKSNISVNYSRYNNWDNIYGLSTFTNSEDLLVFVSARYGDVSYRDSLDGLAKRVGRYYSKQNLILIYPERRANIHIDAYEDVKTAPIFRKISREIGNMFNTEK